MDDEEINRRLDGIEKVVHELRNFEITRENTLDGSFMAVVNQLTDLSLAIKVRAFAIERQVLRAAHGKPLLRRYYCGNFGCDNRMHQVARQPDPPPTCHHCGGALTEA